MKRAIWIVIGLVIIAAIAGGSMWNASQPQLVETALVKKRVLREYVDERAKTSLSRTYLVSMPFAGRIKPIQLDVGAVVKQGDIVAQLEANGLQEALNEASAEVQALKASIREAGDVSVEKTSLKQAQKLVESMGLTVKAANSRTEATRKRWEYAKSFVERVKQLVMAKAKSRDQLDRAIVEAVESEINHRQDSFTAKAMVSMAAATDLMPEMITRWMKRKVLNGEVLLQQLEGAQVRLTRAARRLKQGYLESPVDGVVLERHTENLRFLSAGQLLLKIGRSQDLQFEADVLSQDVVTIRKDSPVEIYGAAVGRRVGSGITARVHRIDPVGYTKISSLGVEQQRVKVIVQCDADQKGQLAKRGVGGGFRVRLRIFTDQKKDALVVPTTSLFRGPDGRWQVYVVRERRARLQIVQLGLQNDTHAEVIEGISEGEAVIVAPESSVQDGSLVKSRG